MDTPNILHIAADRAATSNPGFHGTVLITRPHTAASKLLIPMFLFQWVLVWICRTWWNDPQTNPLVQITSQLIFRSYSRQTDKMYDQYVLGCSLQKPDEKQNPMSSLGRNLGLQLSMWKSSLLHCVSRLAGWKSFLKQNSIQVRLRSHSEGGQWDHWSGASRNREDCFAELNWDTL